LYQDEEMRFNTTTLGKHFPLLQEKIDADLQLYSHVFFKDINVLFGSYDTDVIVSYTVCFALYTLVGEEDVT